MSLLFGLTVAAILIVPLFGVSAKSGQACISEQKIDGCSLPFKTWFFPYATTFTLACNRHDVCYACVSNTFDVG